MTILLVDTDAVRMKQTARMIQALVPDTDGLSTTDPLLAAKYAFARPVDCLIAGLNMKRMNGIQLSNFLWQKDPNIKVCLYASRQEFEACAGIDRAFFPLSLPIRESDLRDILASCQP